VLASSDERYTWWHGWVIAGQPDAVVLVVLGSRSTANQGLVAEHEEKGAKSYTESVTRSGQER